MRVPNSLGGHMVVGYRSMIGRLVVARVAGRSKICWGQMVVCYQVNDWSARRSAFRRSIRAVRNCAQV